MARRDWKLVGVNCEQDLHEALAAWADKNEVNLSEAGRLLLRAALDGEGADLVAQDLKDRGYREGFRQGLRDVHEHMATLKPSR